MPAIEVIGRDGRNLGKWWRENRFQAYEGLSVPYFPNFLTVASPYGSVCRGSTRWNTRCGTWTDCSANCNGVALAPSSHEQANTRFLDRMTELLGDSVFCRQLLGLTVVLVQPSVGHRFSDRRL